MNLWRIGGLLFLIATGTAASAAGPVYECEVLFEEDIGKNGKLEAGIKLYVGRTFHVDRATGTVLGRVLSNSSYATRTVIDPGSEEQSFKLISISAEVGGTDGGHNAAYLEIKEFESGYLKPFILVNNGRVLTGTCE